MQIKQKLQYVGNLKKNKNMHGEHFEDYVWSNENSTCGHDNCSCIFYKHRLYLAENKVQNIINFFDIAKCKNCVFNKL